MFCLDVVEFFFSRSMKGDTPNLCTAYLLVYSVWTVTYTGIESLSEIKDIFVTFVTAKTNPKVRRGCRLHHPGSICFLKD